MANKNTNVDFEVHKVGSHWKSRRKPAGPGPAVSKVLTDQEKANGDRVTLTFRNLTTDSTAPDLKLRFPNPCSRNAFEGPHDQPGADGFPELRRPFVLKKPGIMHNDDERTLVLRHHIGLNSEQQYEIFVEHDPVTGGPPGGGPDDTEVDVGC